MERSLETLIDSFEVFTQVKTIDVENTFVFRFALDGSTDTIICVSADEPLSFREPFGIWFCYKADSRYYRKALKLMGRESGSFLQTPYSDIISDEPFKFKWKEISKYSELGAVYG